MVQKFTEWLNESMSDSLHSNLIALTKDYDGYTVDKKDDLLSFKNKENGFVLVFESTNSGYTFVLNYEKTSINGNIVTTKINSFDYLLNDLLNSIKLNKPTSITQCLDNIKFIFANK